MPAHIVTALSDRSEIWVNILHRATSTVIATTMVSTSWHDVAPSLHRQLRRQSRERREYLFKKSHEAQERAVFDRKQRLKDALASGKALPNELKADARAMGKDLALDEAQTG